MALSFIAPAFMQGFKQVMTADDLLGGNAFPGKKIVIVGGGTVGCETADYLGSRWSTTCRRQTATSPSSR